jgi:hypothetical protein
MGAGEFPVPAIGWPILNCHNQQFMRDVQVGETDTT